MLGSRKNGGMEDEEVDITPMIDITFLMLIFFLVTSTPDQKTEIELAEALHGNAVSQRESIMFSIAFAGLEQSPVYAADGKIPEAALSDDLEKQDTEIQEEVSQGMSEGKENVIIKADKAVPYRNVDRIIKSVSKSEGIKIHLAVLDTE